MIVVKFNPKSVRGSRQEKYPISMLRPGEDLFVVAPETADRQKVQAYISQRARALRERGQNGGPAFKTWAETMTVNCLECDGRGFLPLRSGGSVTCWNCNGQKRRAEVGVYVRRIA